MEPGLRWMNTGVARGIRTMEKKAKPRRKENRFIDLRESSLAYLVHSEEVAHLRVCRSTKKRMTMNIINTI